MQGHWNIRKRFEPEAGQGLPFLLEMLVDDGKLTVADVEAWILLPVFSHNEHWTKMKKNYVLMYSLISNRYPTTAEGGLKTVGLDLRLHYIEFKSAR